MKRLLTRSTLAAALAMAACQHPPHEHAEKARLVVTTPLRKDTELTRDFVAQISAIQRIELRALEPGYLLDVFVDEGQRIAKGTKMFQIMPTMYQAEVQKAVAEADLAEIELSNTKLLSDKNIVSPNELALAKARLAKAKAQVALATAHKSMTEIRAPFDGIMGRFFVRTGSLVSEGELMTTLSDNSTVWAYFNVSEVDYLAYEAEGGSKTKRPVRFRMANGEVFDQPGQIETGAVPGHG